MAGGGGRGAGTGAMILRRLRPARPALERERRLRGAIAASEDGLRTLEHEAIARRDEGRAGGDKRVAVREGHTKKEEEWTGWIWVVESVSVWRGMRGIYWRERGDAYSVDGWKSGTVEGWNWKNKISSALRRI